VRGLAGERAAFWVDGEAVTVEYASETLVRYQVAYAPDGRQFREVGEPRMFPTRYALPQPFLALLEDIAWDPARRLAPYRPRRKRAAQEHQEPLFPSETATAVR
jgi:hypothetical protein